MKTMIRKRYTSEFKTQAIELVSLGQPVPEVAEDLGIGTSILYGWVRSQAQPAQLGSAGLLSRRRAARSARVAPAAARGGQPQIGE